MCLVWWCRECLLCGLKNQRQPLYSRLCGANGNHDTTMELAVFLLENENLDVQGEFSSGDDNINGGTARLDRYFLWFNKKKIIYFFSFISFHRTLRRLMMLNLTWEDHEWLAMISWSSSIQEDFSPTRCHLVGVFVTYTRDIWWCLACKWREMNDGSHCADGSQKYFSLVLMVITPTTAFIRVLKKRTKFISMTVRRERQTPRIDVIGSSSIAFTFDLGCYN